MTGFIVFCVFCLVAWGFCKEMAKPKRKVTRISAEPIDIISSPQNTPTKFVFNPTAENMAFREALFFIGKSDGQLRESERSEMIAYLREVQPEHQESSNYFLDEQIKNLTFLKSKEYKQYIDDLNNKSLRLLFAWSKRIAATQSKMHPFTEYLLEDLENKCNTIVESEFEIVDDVRQYVIS
jgi:hypothetical protein